MDGHVLAQPLPCSLLDRLGVPPRQLDALAVGRELGPLLPDTGERGLQRGHGQALREEARERGAHAAILEDRIECARLAGVGRLRARHGRRRCRLVELLLSLLGELGLALGNSSRQRRARCGPELLVFRFGRPFWKRSRAEDIDSSVFGRSVV